MASGAAATVVRATALVGSLVAVAAVAVAMLPLPGAHRGPTTTPAPPPLYVSPTGADAGPGTTNRPLRTLQAAADRVVPGTVVHVAAGEYRPVVSRRGGAPSARVVYRSDDEWGARIVSRDGTEPWWNHGSHVDIEGFDVTGPRARLGLVSEGSHVRLRQNRVHSIALFAGCDGAGGAGIDHAGYTGVANEITGNWVQDIGPVGGCNTVHGVYLSQPDGVIRGNTIDRVSGWCIHTWHGATRATIRDNLVARCGTAGMRSGGGILIGAGDHPPGVYASDFVVADNTVVDSYRGIVESGRLGGGNRFANNLLARIAEPGRFGQ